MVSNSTDEIWIFTLSINHVSKRSHSSHLLRSQAYAVAALWLDEAFNCHTDGDQVQVTRLFGLDTFP